MEEAEKRAVKKVGGARAKCTTAEGHVNAEGLTGNIVATFGVSVRFRWSGNAITSIGMHYLREGKLGVGV